MGDDDTCTSTTDSSIQKKKRKRNTHLVEEKSTLCDEHIKKEVQDEGTMLEVVEDSSPTDEQAHCTQKIFQKRMKLEKRLLVS